MIIVAAERPALATSTNMLLASLLLTPPLPLRTAAMRPVIRITTPMMDVDFGSPAVVAALSAAAAAGAFAASQFADNGESTEEITIQDRIREARSTSALSYREVEATPLDPATAAERDERRRKVRERAQSMLSDARVTVEEALEEAIATGDAEGEEEYRTLLAKLAPPPEGVTPTNEQPDFKRWIDPNSLR